MRTFIAVSAFAALAAPAFAAPEGQVMVDGSVATSCSGGTVTGADTVFDLGVLIDTSTGFLLPDLSAPPKTLVGSYCNTRSSITVSATPMVAQNANGAAPAGFTPALDYTVTASGWTINPAAYATGAAVHPSATQVRSTAFSGPITVSVSGFTPVGGSNLRPVADPDYRGSVIVSLAVAH